MAESMRQTIYGPVARVRRRLIAIQFARNCAVAWIVALVIAAAGMLAEPFAVASAES